MYKLKSNRNGTFSLIHTPPPVVTLKRINISFPGATSHAGGKTTNYISGPAEVRIEIQHEDGTTEEVKNVQIEW